MKTAVAAVVAMISAGALADWTDAKCGIVPLNRDREEVIRFFSENVYGVRPEFKDFKPTAKVVETNYYADVNAYRLTVLINTMTPIGEKSFKATAYFPKKEGKFPVFVMVGFSQPIRSFDKAHQGQMERWPVDLILKRGYGTVTFVNDDVLPDRADILNGITRPDNGWGAISTWALAASRVVDWLETEPQVDTDKLAVVGLSRLGKTCLWAGAADTRFAMVCPTCSGLLGARCATVNVHGETIDQITKNFPHWFAPKCRTRWLGKDRDLPFDQHWLLAAVAPRLLAVGSSKEDWWACPSGEFTGFFLARNNWQDPSRCNYHIRPGGHALTPVDWTIYMDFAAKHGW